MAAQILVVDDDQSIRDFLKDFFTDLSYTTFTAENGAMALELISRYEMDCIVSDLVMPDMDGLTLLKEVRIRKNKAPFLMVTGYPTIETAVEAIKHGAYDYVTKPLQLEDVRIKVERALHAKGLEASVKKLTGIAWAIIISIPIWLILGIILGRLLLR